MENNLNPHQLESTPTNWTEQIEDLIDSGDTDAAITLLETLISSLNSSSQLSSALFELSKLYSSKGFSLKSDELFSRATAAKLRSQFEEARVLTKDEASSGTSNSIREEAINYEKCKAVAESLNDNVVPKEASDEDDWEAIADRAPDELLSLSPDNLLEVSNLSLDDTNTKARNRRGRGTFTYRKQGLYSDYPTDDSVCFESPDEDVRDKPKKVSEPRKSYGTHHVLVLDGFQPSTTTNDLERLFEDFRDRGFAIRWVNDTLALVVFPSPSIAREACDNVHCSFPVRVLNEDDSIMSCISNKDLDPPRQRPKTSARTAQRLIAQELGVKLPSNFGSRELRKQEDARRNRILTRQNLRDEAWGSDDSK